MKYILLPITIVLWYLTSYYGIYITVIGTAFIFSLSWLWWIIGYLFLMAALFGITISLPSLLKLLILKYYGMSWFSCIVHSLAGLVGLIQIIRLFVANPPELVIGNEPVFILKGMWEVAPIKTIIIVPPFLGFVVSLIWSNIISPVYIKLSGNLDLEEA